MNCNDLKAAAHDYFLKTLAGAAREDFDRHAAACPACHEFVRVCTEIKCKDMVEFLDRYVDNDLDPERRAIFDRHLAICPDCAAYLNAYRSTIQLAKESMRADELETVTHMPEQLVKAILNSIARTG